MPTGSVGDTKLPETRKATLRLNETTSPTPMTSRTMLAEMVHDSSHHDDCEYREGDKRKNGARFVKDSFAAVVAVTCGKQHSLHGVAVKAKAVGGGNAASDADVDATTAVHGFAATLEVKPIRMMDHGVDACGLHVWEFHTDNQTAHHPRQLLSSWK